MERLEAHNQSQFLFEENKKIRNQLKAQGFCALHIKFDYHFDYLPVSQAHFPLS